VLPSYLAMLVLNGLPVCLSHRPDISSRICMGWCICSSLFPVSHFFFFGLIFVSLLCSVICDVSDVRILNIVPDSVSFFRYPPDVLYCHGAFCSFPIGTVLFLAFCKEFLWISLSY
jgi:hypothetical protein